MVLRHLCRPRDPCGAEIKAGAVSINDALALSIAELVSEIKSLPNLGRCVPQRLGPNNHTTLI